MSAPQTEAWWMLGSAAAACAGLWVALVGPQAILAPEVLPFTFALSATLGGVALWAWQGATRLPCLA